MTTQQDSQERARKQRAAGDEGAPYTKLIMDEVTRMRTGLDWSAARLAEEMAAAGVPWTRDVVVNLENGRRKTLAVHEVLALACVLNVNPLALLAPGEGAEAPRIPVLPNVLLSALIARYWLEGKGPPLRTIIDAFRASLDTSAEGIRASVRAGAMTEEMGAKVIAILIDTSPVATTDQTGDS